MNSQSQGVIKETRAGLYIAKHTHEIRLNCCHALGTFESGPVELFFFNVSELNPVGTTMSSHVKLRKAGLVDYETQIKGEASVLSCGSVNWLFGVKGNLPSLSCDTVRMTYPLCFRFLLLLPFQRSAASSESSSRCWTSRWSRRASSCRT